VEVPPGQAPADHLDTADLDDPVAFADRHTRGFGIENYYPLGRFCVNHDVYFSSSNL
jgi:hypothetical protein